MYPDLVQANWEGNLVILLVIVSRRCLLRLTLLRLWVWYYYLQRQTSLERILNFFKLVQISILYILS